MNEQNKQTHQCLIQIIAPALHIIFALDRGAQLTDDDTESLNEMRTLLREMHEFAQAQLR